MTHLEKLQKLAKATDESHIILEAYLNADEGKEWRVVIIGGYPTDYVGSTPEEAIDAAYEKLLPPIPKKVGCWEWDGENYIDVNLHCVLSRGEYGGEFYRFSGQNLASLAFSKESLPDLIKLIEINPELLPPTE